MVPALLLTYGCGSKESGHKKTAEVGWKDMLDNFRDWGDPTGETKVAISILNLTRSTRSTS